MKAGTFVIVIPGIKALIGKHSSPLTYSSRGAYRNADGRNFSGLETLIIPFRNRPGRNRTAASPLRIPSEIQGNRASLAPATPTGPTFPPTPTFRLFRPIRVEHQPRRRVPATPHLASQPRPSASQIAPLGRGWDAMRLGDLMDESK